MHLLRIKGTVINLAFITSVDYKPDGKVDKDMTGLITKTSRLVIDFPDNCMTFVDKEADLVWRHICKYTLDLTDILNKATINDTDLKVK